ncbi:hypothetical protein LWI29_000305 [Acer saccharum]|uniref:Uncharacterized protein n=1 Tax=Acer saccharum TaxID=4024 RepID=A0AA39VNK8_ACESA|nr:hypothetical protein LWI29_000305 [Acer saccharum]
MQPRRKPSSKLGPEPPQASNTPSRSAAPPTAPPPSPAPSWTALALIGGCWPAAGTGLPHGNINLRGKFGNGAGGYTKNGANTGARNGPSGYVKTGVSTVDRNCAGGYTKYEARNGAVDGISNTMSVEGLAVEVGLGKKNNMKAGKHSKNHIGSANPAGNRDSGSRF